MYIFDLGKGINQFKEWKKQSAKWRNELKEAETNIEAAITAKKQPATEDRARSAQAARNLEQFEKNPPKHDLTNYVDSIYTFVLLVAEIDYSHE